MKKVRFDVLSNVKCRKCGKILKVNLVERKPGSTLCYGCYHQDVIAVREGYHGKGRTDRRFEVQR